MARTTLGGSSIARRNVPKVDEAKESVEKIRECLGAGRLAYLALAGAVLEFDELKVWDETEQTKTDYLKGEDVDIDYTAYYKLVGVGRLARAIGVEKLNGIPPYRIERGVLPMVTFDGEKVGNAEEVAGLLADAATLSREDFFIRARELRHDAAAAPLKVVKEGEILYGPDDAPIGNIRRVEVSAAGDRHTLVLSVATPDIQRQGAKVRVWWNNG